MNIAVTYENGSVFQHFGKTEQFKVYQVEDNTVITSRLVTTNGTGHEALADFLKENEIEVVLCGGLGDGMQAALNLVGIEVVSGLQGDADAAVEAYLSGTLESAGVNCHHDEGDCSCGGDCGGCCGCHGAPAIEGENVGKTVRVNYRGTFNDGTQFDSSYDRGEPLEFVCGAGMMIPGFDAAVATMEIGEEIDIHLLPADAYGEANPGMIFPVEIAQLPGSEDLTVGQRVYLYDQMGQPFLVKVIAKDETTVTFDGNHEMAGKELNFHIQLLSAE